MPLLAAQSYFDNMPSSAARLEIIMTDDFNTFELHFEDVSLAEAAVVAERLRDELLDVSPDVKIDVHKPDTTTMDFGATLVMVLGTPAILAIAKGISVFLARERAGTLVIKRNGDVVFKGNSSDAAKIAASLGQRG
jgi:hypothetical protein